MEGSAKGPDGWFRIDTAYVSFDHPYHASFDHTLNIDLVNERAAGVARVAIELSPPAARALVEKINAALHRARLKWVLYRFKTLSHDCAHRGAN